MVTDGALKTITIAINSKRNTEDGELHISQIQRQELKKWKQKGRGMELNTTELCLRLKKGKGGGRRRGWGGG